MDDDAFRIPGAEQKVPPLAWFKILPGESSSGGGSKMPATAPALLLAHGFVMERNIAGFSPGHKLKFHLKAKLNSSSGGHRWVPTRYRCLEGEWHLRTSCEGYALDIWFNDCHFII